MKTQQQLRELMAFFLDLESRMKVCGRPLIALHARGQYRRYRRLLTGSWGEDVAHAG